MALIDSGKTFDKEGHHDNMKKRAENMDTKPYLLRIPGPLMKKVKHKLVEEDRSLREILLQSLYQYINE